MRDKTKKISYIIVPCNNKKMLLMESVRISLSSQTKDITLIFWEESANGQRGIFQMSLRSTF